MTAALPEPERMYKFERESKSLLQLLLKNNFRIFQILNAFNLF